MAENQAQATRVPKRGLLGSVGLPLLGGCAAAVGGGAAAVLLAIAAGYFLGEINVEFPNSPEQEEVLSDSSGPVRLRFGEDRTLDEYEGLLPRFNLEGATQATVDLATGEVTGTVTTPEGDRRDLAEIMEGLRAERLPGDNRIRVGLTTSDGKFEYEMDFSRVQAEDEGRRLRGDIEVTRRITRNGEVIVEDIGMGRIEAEHEAGLDDPPPEPLDPLPTPVKVDAGPDMTIEDNQTVVLQASASGGEGELHFAWQPQESLSNPTVLQPEASPAVTTTYTLAVADTVGQLASDTVTITVPDGGGEGEQEDEGESECECVQTVANVPPPGFVKLTTSMDVSVTGSGRGLVDIFESVYVDLAGCGGFPSTVHEVGENGEVLQSYWITTAEDGSEEVSGPVPVTDASFAVADGCLMVDAPPAVRGADLFDPGSVSGACAPTGVALGPLGLDDEGDGFICLELTADPSCKGCTQQEDIWTQCAGPQSATYTARGSISGVVMYDWCAEQERYVDVSAGDTVTVTADDTLVVYEVTGAPEAEEDEPESSIVMWGNDGWGQAFVPAGFDFAAISADNDYSLALRTDGSIVGWGSNPHGQIDVPAGNDFAAISAGTTHCLAIKTDGSLVGWGGGQQNTGFWPDYGQANPPTGSDFTAVSAGNVHSLALKADGSIVGWGKNDRGETDVPAGNDFVAVAAGMAHSVALKSDGSIVVWGCGGDTVDLGQCDAPAGSGFVAIAAGHDHGLALKTDGSIVGWGYSQWGQIDVPAGSDFTAIAAGGHDSAALKADGSIVRWGYASFIGEDGPPTGNDFTAIAVGDGHGLALRR